MKLKRIITLILLFIFISTGNSYAETKNIGNDEIKRLMSLGIPLIDVRRKVRTVANQVLFEPNREATLARFSSLVNPILGRIQAQQGVDRYKVVIDTTTTTQQDVENNLILLTLISRRVSFKQSTGSHSTAYTHCYNTKLFI